MTGVVQCLVPWLDGLPDPGILKTDLAAIGATLLQDLSPALSDVLTDTENLQVLDII